MKEKPMPLVMGLTFTFNMSLDDWNKLGILEREKLIYENHLANDRFDEVVWFTYGRKDKELRDRLVEEGKLNDRIKVVGAPGWVRGKVTAFIYSFMLPLIRKKDCKNLSIIKSNQMGGARVAARISHIYGIPFDLRTGYTYTLFYSHELERDKLSRIKRISRRLWLLYYISAEKRLYRQCDIATVSSRADKNYIVSNYHIPSRKVTVLTNYIDCNLFCNNSPFSSRENRIVFVGRINKQKNLFNMLSAISRMKIGVDIYGAGEMEKELKDYIRETCIDANNYGKVSNDSLPQIYNRYKYYILPSYYEGMPKTLLEAMACGCVCIGTDVEGTREVIDDGINGYLASGVEPDSIMNAIKRAIESPTNNEVISDRAREYIFRNHSLETIAQKEWEVMNTCLV